MQVLTSDHTVIGLCVGGSWLSNEIDQFSDLDLILVTTEKVSGNKQSMLYYAARLGTLLSGFTGEHVGESRLLICLYDDPLLHVDIKFLTLSELNSRIENPVILLDKNQALENTFNSSSASFPSPEFQWLEDRFWTWVHYVITKVGRGEYLEALDFFGFLRMVVFGPLLHIQNNNMPRGVRKVETLLVESDIQKLLSTVPVYEAHSLVNSLMNAVELYRELRVLLYPDHIILQHDAEKKVMAYVEKLKMKFQ